MATTTLSDDDLADIFAQLDVDGRGWISVETLVSFGERSGLSDPSRLTVLDTDNTGKITLSSFAKGVRAIFDQATEQQQTAPYPQPTTNGNNNNNSSSSSSSEENELGHHPSHDRNTRPNADAKETARQLHNGSAQHTPDHATPHLSIRVTNTDTGDTVDASSSSSSHDAAAAHDHDAELGLLTSGSGGTHLGVYDGDDSHSRSRTETPHTYGTGDSDSESSDHNSSHTHSHNTSTEHSHNHRATTIATPGTSSPALSKEGSSHHLPVRHAESEGELLAGLPHSPAHFSARA